MVRIGILLTGAVIYLGVVLITLPSLLFGVEGGDVGKSHPFTGARFNAHKTPVDLRRYDGHTAFRNSGSASSWVAVCCLLRAAVVGATALLLPHLGGAHGHHAHTTFWFGLPPLYVQPFGYTAPPAPYGAEPPLYQPLPRLYPPLYGEPEQNDDNCDCFHDDYKRH